MSIVNFYCIYRWAWILIISFLIASFSTSVPASDKPQEFLDQIEKAREFLLPYAKTHDHGLLFKNFWNNDQYNATARVDNILEQTRWILYTYGGFIHDPLSSPDAFMALLCHEAGHFVGGYPYIKSLNEIKNTTSEGSADYFAASVCLPRVWADETEINLKYFAQSPPEDLAHCSKKFQDPERLGLCSRIIRSQTTLLKLWARVKGHDQHFLKLKPSFTAIEHLDDHPTEPCRLETSLRGVLCESTYPIDHIPTFSLLDNLLYAKEINDNYFCEDTPEAQRPSCWYHPPLQTNFPVLPFTLGNTNSEQCNGFFIQPKKISTELYYLTSTSCLSEKMDDGTKSNSFDVSLKSPVRLEYISRSDEKKIYLFDKIEFLSTKKTNFAAINTSNLLIHEPLSIKAIEISASPAYPGQQVLVYTYNYPGFHTCTVDKIDHNSNGVQVISLSADCLLNLKRKKDIGSPIVDAENMKLVGMILFSQFENGKSQAFAVPMDESSEFYKIIDKQNIDIKRWNE